MSVIATLISSQLKARFPDVADCDHDGSSSVRVLCYRVMSEYRPCSAKRRPPSQASIRYTALHIQSSIGTADTASRCENPSKCDRRLNYQAWAGRQQTSCLEHLKHILLNIYRWGTVAARRSMNVLSSQVMQLQGFLYSMCW